MGLDFDLATPESWQAALAALAWQADCGVTEVIGDTPVDAFALPDRTPPAAAPARPAADAPPPAPTLARPSPAADLPAIDPVAEARHLARAAATLPALQAAITGFDHCELKQGARNTVFSDGNPAARLLILGEAPGREEDIEGRPFVGRAGQLLDRMFAAIGLSRTSPDPVKALYITNVMYWRPPQNRDPEPAEIAMMLPFVERHIDLVDPELIVLMGNTPLYAATGSRGILRQRGTWITAFGRPTLPMTHPAYLLRNPIAKREAWADLLAVAARLQGPPP